MASSPSPTVVRPPDAEPVASEPDRTEPRRSSLWLSLVCIAGFVVALDRLSKRSVDANRPLYDSWPTAAWPVRFMHVKNAGAAFSLLQNQTVVLTVMGLLGLVAILFYFRLRPSDHPILRAALALQLGGAIGNLIDRVRHGEVTDFIRFPYWPVFNVADSAISIGVVVVGFLLNGDGVEKRRTTGDVAA